MNDYIGHFYRLTRHRYFVMHECWKQHLYLLGILHDINKYLPVVFIPYAKYSLINYKKNSDSTGYYSPHTDYDKLTLAMNWHTTHSKHHWQYWSVQAEADNTVALDIPEKYIKEMICDWIGANIAGGRGRDGARAWYINNGDKLLLSNNTRKYIKRFFNIEDGGWRMNDEYIS
jgi:hypothetical protein